MLTGGRIADLYGRRLVFATGLVIFTLSSLACGLASSAAGLIAARAFEGAGGALMMPATLSIIAAAFVTEERALRSASGLVSRGWRSRLGRWSVAS
jgi:MFS family permease